MHRPMKGGIYIFLYTRTINICVMHALKYLFQAFFLQNFWKKFDNDYDASLVVT